MAHNFTLLVLRFVPRALGKAKAGHGPKMSQLWNVQAAVALGDGPLMNSGGSPMSIFTAIGLS